MTTKPLIAAGLLLGAGLGGFVDGIVFHQILQLHNMVSGWLPPTNLIDAKVNMFWDGVFHAAVWLMTLAGLVLLWRAGARRDVPWSGQTFSGAWLMGWGLFNTVEGFIDHFWLGLHHVNEYAANPRGADWLFQLSGALLLLSGWLFVHAARRGLQPPNSRTGA